MISALLLAGLFAAAQAPAEPAKAAAGPVGTAPAPTAPAAGAQPPHVAPSIGLPAPAAPPSPTAATGASTVQTPRAEAADARATSAVDKTKIGLGDAFTLTVEVEHAASDTVSLPDPLSVGDLSVRGAPAVNRTPAAAAGRVLTRFTVPLVNLKMLAPRVPELAVRVDGPAGPRQAIAKGVSLELVSLVQPGGQPTKEKGPRPPKKPVQILVRSYLWVGVLFGALAVAGLIYLAAVLGKRARERRRIAAIPPPLSVDEQALQRIMDLKRRAPWNQGLGRAAIFELSEIVRGYLGKRLGFDAVDLTNDELLLELRRRRILGLNLSELTEELSWEGMVKFAKLEPTAEECEAALLHAAELVERTKPLPEPLPPLERPEARA